MDDLPHDPSPKLSKWQQIRHAEYGLSTREFNTVQGVVLIIGFVCSFVREAYPPMNVPNARSVAQPLTVDGMRCYDITLVEGGRL